MLSSSGVWPAPRRRFMPLRNPRLTVPLPIVDLSFLTNSDADKPGSSRGNRDPCPQGTTRRRRRVSCAPPRRHDGAQRRGATNEAGMLLKTNVLGKCDGNAINDSDSKHFEPMPSAVRSRYPRPRGFRLPERFRNEAGMSLKTRVLGKYDRMPPMIQTRSTLSRCVRLFAGQ
jgi:hypothetical protein